MPEKDPNNWSLAELLPWFVTLLISVAATIAQYAAKVRSGEPFEGRALLLDGAICVFVGLVTHMICAASGVDEMWRSVAVAINSHMGTRAVMQWERLRDRILGISSIR
jgi:hypothetical protein